MSTEGVNERSRHIDEMSTIDMIRVINQEDYTVAQRVEQAIPQISAAVDAIYERMRRGGRLIYIGAGTSGRLAVQDAAECTVTYGVPKGTVIAIMAGGRDAVFAPSENVEDNFDAGRKDVDLVCVTEKDCLMGISASGNASYVCGALKEASERGALTIGMICNEQGRILEFSQYMIRVPTGAEVISGSTRMKAGTAQKMVLNMISTAVMIKLGKVTDNFMTWMTPTNQKLHKRACFIISKVCSVTEEVAARLLEENGNNIQRAIHAGKETI